MKTVAQLEDFRVVCWEVEDKDLRQMRAAGEQTNALSLMRVPYNDFAKYRLFVLGQSRPTAGKA